MADRRRLQELMGVTPMGAERIPYDQTDPMQQVSGGPPPGPLQAGPETGAAVPTGQPDLTAPDPNAPTGLDLASVGGGVQGGDTAPPAAALGGPPGQGGTTDDLTGNQLAQLSQPIQDLQSPEEAQVAALDNMLSDPNTPPQQKQAIQQALTLAARRRLMSPPTQGPSLGGMS